MTAVSTVSTRDLVLWAGETHCRSWQDERAILACLDRPALFDDLDGAFCAAAWDERDRCLTLIAHGFCRTSQGDLPLRTGALFSIPPDVEHAFSTASESFSVIAYHPDSDFGPTDDDHPMLNRTFVRGVSARRAE